jgi:bacterial/archaeal transporter family-2 protein
VNGTAGATVLALAAGLAGAAQIAVQGRLGERVGSLEAVLIATVVTALAVGPVLLLVRRGAGGLGEVGDVPRWMLVGGLLGGFIVLSITIAGPRIGTTATVALLIAGQLVAATAIDRFGWFGFDRIGLDPVRTVGIVLLVVGAAMTLRR